MHSLHFRPALLLGILGSALAIGSTASASANPVPGRLYGIAQDGSAKALVPFDVSATGQLTERASQSVSVPQAARTLVVGRDGRTVYVGSTQGFDNGFNLIPGTIKVFSVADGGSLTLLQTVAAPPRQMAVSPDGSRLYEWDDYGLVVSFPILGDGSLGTAMANPSVTGSARAIAFAPDGATVYVATYPQQLQQYAVAGDGSLTARTPAEVGIFGCRADFLGITPDGSQLDALCYNQGITLTLAGHGLAFNGSLFNGWGGSSNAEDVRARAVYKAIYPNALEQLQRQPDGSLLDFATPLISDTATISGIAVDPSGSLLVAGTDGHLIKTFAIAADGSLSSAPTATATTTLNALTNLVYAPDQPPVASLGATRDGATAHFDASSSSAVNGTIMRYDWTFGDGTSLADGGPRPDHRYSTPGAYVARVTLTDSSGCSVAETFTGVMAICAGSANAAATLTVHAQGDAMPPPVPPSVTPPVAEPTTPAPSSTTPSEQPSRPAPEMLVVPRSLTGTPSPSGSRVQLTWTPAPGAPVSKRYLIAWSSLHSAQGPADPNMRHIWTTDTRLLVAGARPGTTLHYAIYAYGSDGHLVKAGKTTIRV